MLRLVFQTQPHPKQDYAELGLTERRHVEAIFHDNAARLIAGILERKGKAIA